MSQSLPVKIIPFRRPAAAPGRADSGALAPTLLQTYRLLSEHGAATVPEVARHLRLPREQLESGIAELAGMKLIRRTDDGRVFAVPGGQALDDLLGEQTRLLEQAVVSVSAGRRQLRTLLDNLRLLEPAEAAPITTTMLGTGQRGMFDLPGDALETVSAMHPGGSFGEELLDRSLARAEQNLRRNVCMLVIHQTSALRHVVVKNYLAELAAMGCRVRIRDNLPFRLLLIDSVSAVCSVPAVGSYLLRGERVMALLNRLFETTWVDATPLERAEPMTGPALPCGPQAGESPDGIQDGVLSSAHQSVLRLLAEGHTDQSIARTLGVTTRTVGRRINEVYQALGVDSRFQAGVRAKELGVV